MVPHRLGIGMTMNTNYVPESGEDTEAQWRDDADDRRRERSEEERFWNERREADWGRM